MVRVIHFVKKSEFRKYYIKGFDIKLEINRYVFPPSVHGCFFAENLNINKGEKVIDIGSGSGILGIVAAKLGGDVKAVDNDRHAVELTIKNAKLNNVTIDCRRGRYFGNFRGKFDVIIANLPQEIVHPSYKKAIGNKLTNTIDGGIKGNFHILKLFDLAKKYMHSKSRMYIIVPTSTYYYNTLKEMLKNYDAKLIGFEKTTTKEFISDNIEWYKKMNKRGQTTIFIENGTYMVYEFLFELTLKRPCRTLTPKPHSFPQQKTTKK